MWTLIFMVLMIMIFGKLFIFSIKAAWGITRILFTVVLLPIILICMVAGGLLSLALPFLIVIGIGSLFCKLTS